MRAVERFSMLGEHGAIWIAIGLAGAAADPERREEWLAGSRRVGLSYLVNQLLKVIVKRPRPPAPRAPTLSGLSFPSAHATTSFCGGRMYARLGLNLYPLAFAIALSRLVLRVHHPSDVVAGAALGTVIAR
jgi:membrane-associated phospholipid phosphatase